VSGEIVAGSLGWESAKSLFGGSKNEVERPFDPGSFVQGGGEIRMEGPPKQARVAITEENRQNCLGRSEARGQEGRY